MSLLSSIWYSDEVRYWRSIIGKWPGTFMYQGRSYRYLNHTYNGAWDNERTVEVPIIMELVKRVSPDRILEVGNVLSHYYQVKHDIIDKYEKAANVLNEDIAGFSTSKRYELIVSISTLEHVGFDEPEEFDPGKLLMAIQILKKHLTAGGRLVFTVPRGYNKGLDGILEESNVLDSVDLKYLKRVSQSNQWTECGLEDIRSVSYGAPYYCANGLVLGYYCAPDLSNEDTDHL